MSREFKLDKFYNKFTELEPKYEIDDLKECLGKYCLECDDARLIFYFPKYNFKTFEVLCKHDCEVKFWTYVFTEERLLELIEHQLVVDWWGKAVTKI